MGNSSRKLNDRPNRRKNNSIQRERSSNSSQFSLSSFANNANSTNAVISRSVSSTKSALPPSFRRPITNSIKFEQTGDALLPINSINEEFRHEFMFDDDAGARDFSVLEIISKGAFGIVFKVKRTSDQQICALKEICKLQVIATGAVKQVKEEVHIQKVCGHHHFIVKCIQYWQSDKKLFILSDYISGGELQKLLGRLLLFPEDLVRIFVAEIATALDFLHNAGVIYRDLKPENILLNESGHIQLIDFGLSKWLRNGTYTNTICGTLKYMGTI